jgi:hypothetical protein
MPGTRTVGVTSVARFRWKHCYLKLKVRLGNSIRAVSLKISDYHTHKDRYPREKPNQIQNGDG